MFTRISIVKRLKKIKKIIIYVKIDISSLFRVLYHSERLQKQNVFVYKKNINANYCKFAMRRSFVVIHLSLVFYLVNGNYSNYIIYRAKKDASVWVSTP